MGCEMFPGSRLNKRLRRRGGNSAKSGSGETKIEAGEELGCKDAGINSASEFLAASDRW